MPMIITVQEIKDLLSVEAADLVTDDLTTAPTPDEFIERSISWVETNLVGRLLQLYSPANLAKSPVIKKVLTFEAAHDVSERRANPAYYSQASEATEKIVH